MFQTDRIFTLFAAVDLWAFAMSFGCGILVSFAVNHFWAIIQRCVGPTIPRSLSKLVNHQSIDEEGYYDSHNHWSISEYKGIGYEADLQVNEGKG